MRRADRLFQIIQILRRVRAPVTAAAIAAELETSKRSVYRDIAALQAMRVPIEGGRGIGYILRPGFDLPPLMFTEEEIEALVLGARIVSAWADKKLARAAEEALQKIETVLPPRLKSKLAESALMAPGFHVSDRSRSGLEPLRRAIREQRKARFRYVDKAQAPSERVVHPLGLAYWGQSWTLTAWCEMRNGFRNFRLDRIDGLQILEDRFESEPGRTLADFLALMAAEERTRPAARE
jgi:predicted DNA-binding transcriptional regulator YafY